MPHLVPDHTVIKTLRMVSGTHGEGDPVALIYSPISYIQRDVPPVRAAAGNRVHLFDLAGLGQSERPWNLVHDRSVTAQVPVVHKLPKNCGQFPIKDQPKQTPAPLINLLKRKG
ncbi:hypothetical protein [Ruegeria sp. A3M17]|uniref:hypothetical protein n=1 Tax=Ruegeria sp. A3M17 TaxID=2267229 RepID=UPI000DE876F6|nr:hypothetical protein [Ruegeria sp. A3M17]RBW61714.1 hypothetical protein DS906_03935 [Ruegeria sp. A3M17]